MQKAQKNIFKVLFYLRLLEYLYMCIPVSYNYTNHTSFSSRRHYGLYIFKYLQLYIF